MSYRFVLADVFTDTAFGGNQRAVFPDARGLSQRAMQTLAREFNIAETTFVLPPDDPGHTRRVRIFTPRTELPFAGPPTLGTAAVLAHLGPEATIPLEEGVGVVSVALRLGGAVLVTRLSLTAEVESPPLEPVREDLAVTLALSPAAVREAWFAGIGVRFCFVRLADRSAVDAAALDGGTWTARIAGTWAPQLFLFTGDTEPGGHLYARMFAPAFGIAEDPATGSACTALAGTLAARAPQRAGTFTWRIDQGVAMGRPSLIEAMAEKRDGHVTAVGVGGSTVIVGEGAMIVPPGY